MKVRTGRILIVIVLGIMVLMTTSTGVWAATNDSQFSKVKVVDRETGRGIPLVRVDYKRPFYTDSQGIAAIHDPGIMGKNVWVTITSPGYEYRRFFRGSNTHGDKIKLESGNSVTLQMDRLNVNVSERLYRITGAGIYRDSVLLGETTPIDDPLIEANVMNVGQGISAVFNGKVFWFWSFGAQQPNANFQFKISGATSNLPKWGGLNPTVGVDLNFFENADGFSRKMLPIPGGDPVSIKNLMVTSTDGSTSMYTYYRLGDLGSRKEHGIAKWDEASQEFKIVKTFADDMNPTVCRNTVRVKEDGKEWFYFACPFPITRVPADPASLKDPDSYETFTIVKSGDAWQGPDQTPLNSKGWFNTPRWVWDTGTATINNLREAELIQAGRINRDKGIHHLTDVISGDTVVVHDGSVYWNEFRSQWVMIANQLTDQSNRSNLGEIWYAEGDSPLGPWVYGRRIATHYSNKTDRHYNLFTPRQHPYLNRNKGRTIFFSGVLTNQLTADPSTEGNIPASVARTRPVPRYNGNELMYGLDLADTRLHLPTPVYAYEDSQGASHYGTSTTFTDTQQKAGIVLFYAYGPKRHNRPDSDPVLAVDDPQSDTLPVPFWEKKVEGEPRTILASDSSGVTTDTPAFYAWPLDVKFNDSRRIVKLNRYDSGTRTRYLPPQYEDFFVDGWTNKGAIARVWASPRPDPRKNPHAEPVRKCLGSSAVCDGN